MIEKLTGELEVTISSHEVSRWTDSITFWLGSFCQIRKFDDATKIWNFLSKDVVEQSTLQQEMPKIIVYESQNDAGAFALSILFSKE